MKKSIYAPFGTVNGPFLSARLFCLNSGQSEGPLARAARQKAERSLQKASSKSSAVSTKVYEAAKTSFDFTIVFGALGLAGVIFGTLFMTLFSSSSPYKVYNESLKIIQEHGGVCMLLGEPILGFDESSHRRGGTMPSVEGKDDAGRDFVRCSYNIQGPRGKATVVAEKKNHDGTLEFEYIAVMMPGRNPVFVLDNRMDDEFSMP